MMLSEHTSKRSSDLQLPNGQTVPYFEHLLCNCVIAFLCYIGQGGEGIWLRIHLILCLCCGHDPDSSPPHSCYLTREKCSHWCPWEFFFLDQIGAVRMEWSVCVQIGRSARGEGKGKILHGLDPDSSCRCHLTT